MQSSLEPPRRALPSSHRPSDKPPGRVDMRISSDEPRPTRATAPVGQLATTAASAADEPRGRQHSRSTRGGRRAELPSSPRANTVGAATRLGAASCESSGYCYYSRPQSRRARSIGWIRPARTVTTTTLIDGEALSRGEQPCDAAAAAVSSRSRATTRSRHRRRCSERASPAGAAATAAPDFNFDFNFAVLVRLADRAEPFPSPGPTPESRSRFSVVDHGADLADEDNFSPLFSPEHLTALHLAEHGAGGGGGRESGTSADARHSLSYLVPEDDEAWTAAARAGTSTCSPKLPGDTPVSAQSFALGHSRMDPDDLCDRARRRLVTISTHLVPERAKLGSVRMGTV